MSTRKIILVSIFAYFIPISAGYPNAEIDNKSDYDINILVEYQWPCKADSFTAPHKAVAKAPGKRGVCLITKVKAWFHVNGEKKEVEYKSAGTTYSQFVFWTTTSVTGGGKEQKAIIHIHPHLHSTHELNPQFLDHLSRGLQAIPEAFVEAGKIIAS